MIGRKFNTTTVIFALAVLASCCHGEEEEDYVPLKEVVASLDSGYTKRATETPVFGPISVF